MCFWANYARLTITLSIIVSFQNLNDFLFVKQLLKFFTELQKRSGHERTVHHYKFCAHQRFKTF